MNYGSALPIDFKIPKSAFWLRNDLEKRNPFIKVVISPGDLVMDCGAYIGTFSAAALEQEAGSVCCYEAEPKNGIKLVENLARYGSRAQIVLSALTSNFEHSVVLTLSGFSGANSILSSPNRKKSITVPALNFRAELLRIRPRVLKLDVEGAEYSLLDSLEIGDLESVNSLFIEFHPIEGREEKIREIRRFIELSGFLVVEEKLRKFTANRIR